MMACIERYSGTRYRLPKLFLIARQTFIHSEVAQEALYICIEGGSNCVRRNLSAGQSRFSAANLTRLFSLTAESLISSIHKKVFEQEQ
jgi:hypothetical protein